MSVARGATFYAIRLKKRLEWWRLETVRRKFFAFLQMDLACEA